MFKVSLIFVGGSLFSITVLYHCSLSLFSTKLDLVSLTQPSLTSPLIHKGVVEHDVPLALHIVGRDDADQHGASVFALAAGEMSVKPDAPAVTRAKLRDIAGCVLVEKIHELLNSPASGPLLGTLQEVLAVDAVFSKRHHPIHDELNLVRHCKLADRNALEQCVQLLRKLPCL